MASLVVLDTNVIQEDFLMRSPRFEILFDYVKRTRSDFLLPQIVADELFANYERELRSRVAKLTRAEEQLNGISIEPISAHTPTDVPKKVAEYKKYVKRRLELAGKGIVPYSEANMRDALNRAIQRRRPCSDHGEEIRDAILWNMVLDAADDKSRHLIFISKNTNEFSADKITLHFDLAKEMKERGANIAYFPSLEEFAKQHATKIAFITKEWLESQIDPDLVLDAAEDTFVDTARAIAKRRARPEVDGISTINAGNGSLEVDEFFVYEMTSGDFRVEITWHGWAEFEYQEEIVESETEWESRYNVAEDDVDVEPVFHRRRRTKDSTVELSLNVVTDVIVEEGKVADWHIVDTWAEE